MELERFTNLIDVVGRIAGGPRSIVNPPNAERETIRRTMDETYRLTHTTCSTVIIRLGDILLYAPDDDFLREAAWAESLEQLQSCRVRSANPLF